MVPENTGVATPSEVYNRSLETFKGGAEILQQTQDTVTKAVMAGQNLLNKIKANDGKLTAELDKACNDYIAKCNQRKKELEENRKPITQIMDAVKQLFTTEEKKIDVKNADAIAYQLQLLRNKFAEELAMEQKRIQEEATRKAEKDKEAVQLKAEAERRIFTHFSNYMGATKQGMTAEFNSATLESIDGKQASLMAYQPVYPYEHFQSFQHALASRYHTADEVNLIVKNATIGKFDTYATEFKTEVGNHQRALLDRFASKKEELQAIERNKENEAERKRLEDERIRREKEEEEKLKAEQQERERAEKQKIDMQETADETLVMFQKEADIQAATDIPETRQGYDITINNPAGYVQIFSFWFEHEAKTLPAEKIEKKTIGQMIAFAEKKAHKDDVKIESPYISYKPSFKAVNRRDS